MSAHLSSSYLLMVALGGALGSVLRYVIAISLNSAFPWGTLSVNVLGCTLMGALTAFFAQYWPSYAHLRLFITVGMLGGFTTFSSFALDIGQLTENSQIHAGLFYGFASLILSLLGFFLAQMAMKAFLA